MTSLSLSKFCPQVNLSQIGTYDSQKEPDLLNTTGDLTVGSRTLELLP